MNEQEFMEHMKRAKSKVKDGLFTPIVDNQYLIAMSS